MPSGAACSSPEAHSATGVFREPPRHPSGNRRTVQQGNHRGTRCPAWPRVEPFQTARKEEGMKRTVHFVGLALLCAIGSVSRARAAQQVISTTFPMPVRAQLTFDVSDCGSDAGPSLSVHGGLALRGLGTDVFFRSAEKGTRTVDERPAGSLVLLPAGQAIVVPRQPVQGGAGGRSFVWLAMVDPAGRPLTSPIAVGRCAPGPTTITADFFLPVTVSVGVQALACDNSPGPYVILSGGVTFAGLNARLLFTDGDQPATGPHAGDPPPGVE